MTLIDADKFLKELYEYCDKYVIATNSAYSHFTYLDILDIYLHQPIINAVPITQPSDCSDEKEEIY